MLDEEINLANPNLGADILAQWDGFSSDPKTQDLHGHWSSDIELTTARWIWIKFAKPSWILGAKLNKTNSNCYPTVFAGYYSTDNGHQMISLFEVRKIMLGPQDDFIEQGIAPIYSDNILLVFDKFSIPEEAYLPELKDINVIGYFD